MPKASRRYPTRRRAPARPNLARLSRLWWGSIWWASFVGWKLGVALFIALLVPVLIFELLLGILRGFADQTIEFATRLRAWAQERHPSTPTEHLPKPPERSNP